MENKDLCSVFCQVEVPPVTLSYQRFIRTNTCPVRALRKCQTNTMEVHKNDLCMIFFFFS